MPDLDEKSSTASEPKITFLEPGEEQVPPSSTPQAPPVTPPFNPSSTSEAITSSVKSVAPPDTELSLPPPAPGETSPKEPLSVTPPPQGEELTLSPRIPPEVVPPQLVGQPPPAQENKPPFPPGVTVAKSKPLIFRFLTILLVVAILAGLGFAGYIGWKYVLPLLPASVRPGGVTLTYWGLWEDENVMKSTFNEYEKDHKGIKIDYKKQSPKEYRERLQAALTSGKGPDIFRFHNTWLPMLKSDLAPVPSSVFSANDFVKTFYPAASIDLKQGNSYYGIPVEIDGLALLCNVEIFKAAGLTPPATWEEFQNSAHKLTVKDQNRKIQTAGVALGTSNNIDNWSDILAVMFLQNGVDLKNPQGQLAEDALIFYTSFAQGENNTWDETLPPSTLAFAQGRVAMIFAPSWQILTIKASNPRLNFKVLPVPQLPGVNITWASYWVEGVSAKSAHQVEAWEFLRYLSQKETLVKFYSEASKTRLFGEPYSRQDLAASLKDDPYLGPYIQQAPVAQSFYMASRTFDNGINDKIIKYFEDAVTSVNKGVSPRGALETVAKGVQQVLSTYTAPSRTPSVK